MVRISHKPCVSGGDLLLATGSTAEVMEMSTEATHRLACAINFTFRADVKTNIYVDAPIVYLRLCMLVFSLYIIA